MSLAEEDADLAGRQHPAPLETLSDEQIREDDMATWRDLLRARQIESCKLDELSMGRVWKLQH